MLPAGRKVYNMNMTLKARRRQIFKNIGDLFKQISKMKRQIHSKKGKKHYFENLEPMTMSNTFW